MFKINKTILSRASRFDETHRSLGKSVKTLESELLKTQPLLPVKKKQILDRAEELSTQRK